MRNVPQSITDGWKSPAKIGARRPVVRATIQRQNVKKFDYDTAWSQGGSYERERHSTGRFTSMIFGDNSPLREIRNIKSCSWDRSVDQDAATCTITLLNSEITPIGEPRTNPSSPDEFDKPGHYTFNRGEQRISQNRWGYDTETGWNEIYVPDMIVKTYEGYGWNPEVPAPLDENLVQSGVWMIDKVSYGADGTITLEMRDLARLLLDQIVFPPSVPMAEYPLTWSATRSEKVPSRDCAGGRWIDNLKSIGRASSSNEIYVGKGFTNEPFSKYVSQNGSADGHQAVHAILPRDPNEDPDDPKDSLFWRSTGQDARRNFVWWQFRHDKGTIPISGIRLSMRGGPYRIYVSIHDGNKWLGKKKIPWSRDTENGSTGNVYINADIPFVSSHIADRFRRFDLVLPRKYRAKAVRLTITQLQHTGVGEHPYRAGIREVQIYTGDYDNLTFEKGERLKVVGNYGDYSQIVKWVTAWAGWFWPPHETGQDFMRVKGGELSNPGTKDWVTYSRPDEILPRGRVWGDFMRSGTTGEADLTVDMFDKKPLMDVINYVRDLLGYNFWIDEEGGVIWRMPNIWQLGNYEAPEKLINGLPGKRGRGKRRTDPDDIVVLDEEETLLDYETQLSSTEIRERIFVANAVGGHGTVIKGFNPYPIGLSRTVGWSDQNFKNKRETKVMADMISARNMFTYRTSRAVTPGNPAIQIDDQIRIFERVTNETYYHYVLGIKSEIDMESGSWTYDLTTHWLGERPGDAWIVRTQDLSRATKNYLEAIGYEGKVPEDKDE